VIYPAVPWSHNRQLLILYCFSHLGLQNEAIFCLTPFRLNSQDLRSISVPAIPGEDSSATHWIASRRINFQPWPRKTLLVTKHSLLHYRDVAEYEISPELTHDSRYGLTRNKKWADPYMIFGGILACGAEITCMLLIRGIRGIVISVEELGHGDEGIWWESIERIGKFWWENKVQEWRIVGR